MTTMLCILAWWIIGVCGYIYWWTREFDLKVSDAPFSMIIGLTLGPITWIAGFAIHGNTIICKDRDKILIKKRIK
jgi:hypothetical protein